MASTATATLQEQALRHLWLHFTPMAGTGGRAAVRHRARRGPVRVSTLNGKRYLDFLSGLFTVQIGYSHGEELGPGGARAGAASCRTTRTGRSPTRRAIELASQAGRDSRPRASTAASSSPAARRPSSPPSSWPASTTTPRGEPMRRKVIARKIAYHGTTYGALSLTGITGLRTPFEPLMAGVRHVANTNQYRCKYCADQGGCNLKCADEVAETIEFEGPETVAMVIMEPVQNAGGCFTPHPAVPPARARDLRRLRRAAVRRRGHLRLRPRRRVVRLDPLRLPARPHDDGEGPDERLPADGRAAVLRPRRRARCWRRTTCTCTASRSAGTPSPPPWRSRTSRSWSARACIDNVPRQPGLPRGRAARPDGAPRDHRRRPRRGLLLGHGAGARTARRARRSRPRSATSCCATSSRTRCSTRA